jgi:hypothetical protein
MNKKWLLGSAVIVLLVAVIFLSWPTSLATSNPESWVSTSGSTTSVILERASDALREDGLGLELGSGKDALPFTFDGLYQGRYFYGTVVLDDEGNKLLETTKDLDANDGVPQGFLIATQQDDIITFTAFIDQEFVELVKEPRIVWGKEFENEEDFSNAQEIGQGILVKQVSSPVSELFDGMWNGGVAVGDVTSLAVSEEITENLTVIRLT